jgi:hypothetical protein
MIESAVKKR